MPLTTEQQALLASIRKEWDRAEADIKIAEQVALKIVTPAVKELRYGGRRLVDMLNKMSAGASEEDLNAMLQEACFDCHRARHDAIDAATSKIAIDIEIMIEKLGYGSILPVYPDFPKLFNELGAVRTKIAESRGNRENREVIYSVIESVDFPALVAKYNEMRTSEHMMIALAKKSRRESLFGRYGFWMTAAGTALGAIGVWLAMK